MTPLAGRRIAIVLFNLGGPDDQTVLRRSGPAVRASQVGSAFFDIPSGQADNVLDGDDSTSRRGT